MFIALHVCVGLEWSSTNLAWPQHAMNMYRRQTNTKSPDPSFIQPNMALLLSTHLFHACTHTNIFLMSLFFIFSIHQHCCESSESWREPFSLSFFPHYIFHLQLISTTLLSSHSAILWHFVFLCISVSLFLSFLSIPIVHPTITKLKRDATKSWNMYVPCYLEIKRIQAWNKYPEKRCNAQRLFLHHSWDFCYVMFNLMLKHKVFFFFPMLKYFLIFQKQLIKDKII